MKRDDTGIIKAGMAIVISSGCYSDYSFGQVYIALKDFNYMEEAKKFLFKAYDDEYEKTKDDDFYFSSYELGKTFENYLISQGFLGLCDYREIHVGDYRFFDEEEWINEWKKTRGLDEDDLDEEDE